MSPGDMYAGAGALEIVRIFMLFDCLSRSLLEERKLSVLKIFMFLPTSYIADRIDVVKVEILRKKMSVLLGQIFTKNFERKGR
jgi:hypothetical protein